MITSSSKTNAIGVRMSFTANECNNFAKYWVRNLPNMYREGAVADLAAYKATRLP